MNTIEEIINVELATGESRKSVGVAPISGRVVGVVAYTNDDSVLANASITADNGQHISKPQHIRNYRSREACYFDGCKPLNLQTKGQTYFFEVVTEKPVADTFKVQFILIYEDNRNCEI